MPRAPSFDLPTPTFAGSSNLSSVPGPEPGTDFIFELPAKFGVGRSKLGGSGQIYPEIKGWWLIFFWKWWMAKLIFFDLSVNNSGIFWVSGLWSHDQKSGTDPKVWNIVVFDPKKSGVGNSFSIMSQSCVFLWKCLFVPFPFSTSRNFKRSIA